LATVVAFGLGALISIGIVWVNEVLDASDTEFGLLVGCFGVGAVGGLLIRRDLRRDLRLIRASMRCAGRWCTGWGAAAGWVLHPPSMAECPPLEHGQWALPR
jgi:hypothetical protein